MLEEVSLERENQDRKWGIQRHNDDRWVAILGEEFGEAAHEALEENEPLLREEVLQCAAVCVAWVEAIDRRHR